MKVTYLYHSGFLVETEACYYLFDYYKGSLPKLTTSKPIIVLSSHSHRDHYNPNIFSVLQEMGLQRIYGVLADDITPTALSDGINYLSVSGGREYLLALGQQLITYQSTDEGVAFLLKEGDSVIYHAGDLNDWVWEEEDPRYNEQMTLDYRRQIDALADQLGGHPITCAFVVLDPRQGKDYDRGMLYFLEKVKVHKVYPMHYWEKPQIMKQFLEEHPQYQALVQEK